MTILNVQFGDSDETAIIAYFGGPQDPSAYPNLGQVDTSDDRWEAFYEEVGGAASRLPAPNS